MEYLHQQLEEAQREKAKVAELEQKVKELQSLKEEDRRLSEALSQIKIREELFVHLQRVEEQIKRLEEEEEEAEKKMQEQKVLEEKLKKCEERVEKTQEEMQKMKSSLNILLTKREQLAKEYKELLSHIEKMGKMGKDSICPFCKRRLGEDFESIKEHVHKELERVEREGRGVREKIDRTKAALLKEERICSFLQRKKEEWVQALKRMEGAEKIWNEKRRQREEVSLQRMQILERMSSFEHILYDEKMHQSVRRKIEDLERVAKEVERARAKLEMENKLKEKALEEERRMEQLKEGMDEVKERLEQIEFDEEKFSELERRVEEERESVSLHKEELYKLFAQKASLEKQMQMLQEEMEHIESVAQRLREKEEGVQKLEKLQQIFVDFRMHLISRIRPRLEEIASTFFCSITQGKYQGIKIDEEYQMYIIDGGVAYPLHRFSGGEIDLASLCLRLAISSLLLQAQGVDAGFMILDEIFGSQDIQRRTQIMDALVQLQGFFRQLLLITHIEDVKENVDNLLFVFEDEEGVSHVKVENNFGRRFG
jgi:exonuclease SbcC